MEYLPRIPGEFNFCCQGCRQRENRGRRGEKKLAHILLLPLFYSCCLFSRLITLHFPVEKRRRGGRAVGGGGWMGGRSAASSPPSSLAGSEYDILTFFRRWVSVCWTPSEQERGEEKEESLFLEKVEKEEGRRPFPFPPHDDPCVVVVVVVVGLFLLI